MGIAEMVQSWFSAPSNEAERTEKMKEAFPGTWFRIDKLHWKGFGPNEWAPRSGDVHYGRDFIIYYDDGGLLDSAHLEVKTSGRQRALQVLNDNAPAINAYLKGVYVFDPITEQDVQDFH